MKNDSNGIPVALICDLEHGSAKERKKRKERENQIICTEDGHQYRRNDAYVIDLIYRKNK